MDKDLNARLFNFAISVILYLRNIQDHNEYKIIKYQLIKSSSSSAANYEEAQAASSRPDFSSKMSITLREMRESNFWLRVLERIGPDQDEVLLNLKCESEELKKNTWFNLQ